MEEYPNDTVDIDYKNLDFSLADKCLLLHAPPIDLLVSLIYISYIVSKANYFNNLLANVWLVKLFKGPDHSQDIATASSIS